MLLLQLIGALLLLSLALAAVIAIGEYKDNYYD